MGGKAGEGSWPVDPHQSSNGAPAVGSAVATLIVVGSARLPKSVSGEEPSILMIELVVHPRDGRVADVGTTVRLSGYTEMLQSFLIGRDLNAVEGAALELSAHLRGPLLKPTIAALANCVRNVTRSSEAMDEEQGY